LVRCLYCRCRSRSPPLDLNPPAQLTLSSQEVSQKAATTTRITNSYLCSGRPRAGHRSHCSLDDIFAWPLLGLITCLVLASCLPPCSIHLQPYRTPRQLTKLLQATNHPPSRYIATTHNSPTDTMSQLSREQQLEELEGDYLLHKPKLPTHFSTNPATRFEEDLDNNPHSHFLSPVHMYESWDDSDDDDDDDCQFDAGIMDFALFNDDYKRAKEEDAPLSAKWNDLIAEQAEAYDRAVARTRAEVTDRPTGSSSFNQHDAVPSLTPDTSPRLVDDLDFDSAEESTSTLSLPYRTKIVTPEDLPHRPASAPIDIPRSRFNLPLLSESAIEEEDFADPAAPAFLLYRHSQRLDRRRNTGRPAPPPMRPGMSAGNRTLSGKLHVWKRPSWDLYSVWEEREEEAAQDDSRGRSRSDGALRKKKGMEALRG